MGQSLPTVTLCCVDTSERYPEALRALRRSMGEMRFGDVFIASSTDRLRSLAPSEGIRGVCIPDLKSVARYSEFVVRDLVMHVHTPHVLIVQWDGFVINPSAWSSEFLDFDYIGAPWKRSRSAYRVGNGGFSLRSKQLMERVAELARTRSGVHPEDVFVCRTVRSELCERGLRFAPVSIASRFSLEQLDPVARPFGFHGPANFPYVIGAEGTRNYLLSLPTSRLLARDGRQMFREMSLAVDRLIRRQPEMEGVRLTLERLARCGLAVGGGNDLPPEEIERQCRALIRAGFLSAARDFSDAARGRISEPKYRLLQLRRMLRGMARWVRGLPVT